MSPNYSVTASSTAQDEATVPLQGVSAARVGHGQSNGNFSGAGLWFSDGDPPAQAMTPKITVDEVGPEFKDSTAVAGSLRPLRTYHFTSESATVAARFSGIDPKEWEMMSRGFNKCGSGQRSSNDSERIDLDLSFDFVSQLEYDRKDLTSAETNADANPANSEVTSYSISRPRGMSETVSSLRKRPPKPLAVFEFAPKQGLKSHFSPLTTANTSSISESSELYFLPITPLSATRRGADSGISSGRRRSRTLSGSQPPTRPPTAPLPPLPDSPALQSSSSTASDVAKLQRLHQPGEHFTERMSRQSFLDQSVSLMSPSQVNKPLMPSFPLEVPPTLKGTVSIKPRRPSSPLAWENQLHCDTDVDAGRAHCGIGQNLNLSNSLVLNNLDPKFPTPEAQHAVELLSTSSKCGGPEEPAVAASPATSYLSTPGTTSSSLFDGAVGIASSISSKTTSVDNEGSGSPSRNKLLLQGGRIPMSRGSTAPLQGAIKEEDNLDESRRHTNVGLTSSETAEWIRAQEDSRQREATSTSAATNLSSQPSDEVRQLVLSVSSNDDASLAGSHEPTKEVAAAKTGPWKQSPMLLDDMSRELVVHAEPLRNQSASVVGLGIGLSLDTNVNSQRLQSSKGVLTIGDIRAQSEVLITTVDQQDSSTALQKTTAPATFPENESGRKGASGILSSDSHSSSIEGFAWNVTPSVVTLEPVNDELHPPRGSRLGIKLSRVMTEKRQQQDSAAAGEFKQPLSPRMRSLALVRRNEEDIAKRREIRRHPVNIGSKVSSVTTTGLATSKPLEAACTTPVSQIPIFSTAAVPNLFKGSKRSSKHVRRTSRIQYILDQRKEVQLEMLDATGTLAATDNSNVEAFADIKSPPPVSNSSGETPEMIYGHLQSRHSWGFLPKSHFPWTRQASAEHAASLSLTSPTSESTSSPVSPRLDFGASFREARFKEEHSALLSDSQHAACAGAGIDAGDVAGGLRRRRSDKDFKHRSVLSVPPTATIRAFSWRSSNKRASLFAELVAHEGVKLAEVEEHEEGGAGALEKLQFMGSAPPQEQDAARMSIFVPVAALQAHLRRKAIQEREARAAASSQATATPMTHNAGILKKSLIAAKPSFQHSAGRSLDFEQPSRTLFFAGFLCMPWLWLIGGWWLANDGFMLTPGAEQVEFWRHQPSMDHALQQEKLQCPPTQSEAKQLAEVPSSEPDPTLKRPAGRLDTICSESAGPLFELDENAQSETSDTLSSGSLGISESQNDATRNLKTAHSRLTLAGYGSQAAVSSSQSRRVLFTSDTSKVPLRARNSLGHLLSPHPEVALYHSPIRTANFSEPGSSGTSVQDLAEMSSRHGGRLSLSSRPYQRRTMAGSRLEARHGTNLGYGDDSGVDITVIEESNLHNTQPATSQGRRLTYRGSLLYDINGAPLRLEQTNMLQRLAATEKFVLMNRFMAIVSSIGAFAAMGFALNAVALNF